MVFSKTLSAPYPHCCETGVGQFFASRFTRRAFENIEELIAAEAQIPIADFDLIILNTRGYLKHLRREKSPTTRIVAYQHDLLPYLWRADIEALNAAKTAELLRQQEIDLEYSMGVDLTIAANYALRATLAALTRQKVPLAYPLVDSGFFFPILTPRLNIFSRPMPPTCLHSCIFFRASPISSSFSAKRNPISCSKN